MIPECFNDPIYNVREEETYLGVPADDERFGTRIFQDPLYNVLTNPYTAKQVVLPLVNGQEAPRTESTGPLCGCSVQF